MNVLIKGMEMPTTGLYFVSVDNMGGKDRTVVTVERMLGNRDVRQIIGSFELVPVPEHGRPVVRARWITPPKNRDYAHMIDYYECPLCGAIEDYLVNFCPNCGADMREES